MSTSTVTFRVDDDFFAAAARATARMVQGLDRKPSATEITKAGLLALIRESRVDQLHYPSLIQGSSYTLAQSVHENGRALLASLRWCQYGATGAVAITPAPGEALMDRDLVAPSIPAAVEALETLGYISDRGIYWERFNQNAPRMLQSRIMDALSPAARDRLNNDVIPQLQADRDYHSAHGQVAESVPAESDGQ